MIRTVTLLLVCVGAALPVEVMHNFDVIRMKVRGASDQQIIDKIAAAEPAFSLWTHDVHLLQDNHVSEAVIRAMFARNIGPINPAEILNPPAMAPGMSLVTIRSAPAGARIYVQDIEVGRTPMAFPMPSGNYPVTLVMAGHQPASGELAIQPGQPASLSLSLAPGR